MNQISAKASLIIRCNRCKRPLSSPLSIKRGYGAVCYRKLPKYEGKVIDLSTVMPIPFGFEDFRKKTRNKICEGFAAIKKSKKEKPKVELCHYCGGVIGGFGIDRCICDKIKNKNQGQDRI